MDTWEDEGGAIPDDELEELDEGEEYELIEGWDEFEVIDDYQFVDQDRDA